MLSYLLHSTLTRNVHPFILIAIVFDTKIIYFIPLIIGSSPNSKLKKIEVGDKGPK